MQNLTFKLSLDEANLILEGLSELQMKRVINVINNIQAQAKEQLESKVKKREEVAKHEESTPTEDVRKSEK